MQDVTTLIQSVGFPITCVFFLAYYITKRDARDEKEREQQREDSLKVQETRDKRDEEFLASLSNINEVMTELKTIIKGDDK